MAILGSCLVTHCQATRLQSNQAVFKNKQIHITVTIKANIYTYKVTNLDDSAIVEFEVQQNAAYNFMAPDNWEVDISSNSFRSWTNNPQAAIAHYKTAEFSLRVGSKGAVLGCSPVQLKTQSGEIITIEGVWAPVPEPKSYIFFVGGLVLFILLFHSAIIIIKNRRVEKPS